MQLTTVATYAIIVVQELYSAKGPVSMAKLAEILSAASGVDVTALYVQQVMLGLLRDGIVQSVRGAGGGYELANKRRQVSVYDVIAATSRAMPCDPAAPATLADKIADGVDSHVQASLKSLKVRTLK